MTRAEMKALARRIAADWPPLTGEQQARLSVLLWPDRQPPARGRRPAQQGSDAA